MSDKTITHTIRRSLVWDHAEAGASPRTTEHEYIVLSADNHGPLCQVIDRIDATGILIHRRLWHGGGGSWGPEHRWQ